MLKIDGLPMEANNLWLKLHRNRFGNTDIVAR